jgi:hypothetical protein
MPNEDLATAAIVLANRLGADLAGESRAVIVLGLAMVLARAIVAKAGDAGADAARVALITRHIGDCVVALREADTQYAGTH